MFTPGDENEWRNGLPADSGRPEGGMTMSSPTPAREGSELDRVLLQRMVADLTVKFDGVLAPETVERCVKDSYESVASTARIRTYLVPTAGHLARNRLTELARSADSSGVPEGRPAPADPTRP
jgi:hypothetical protein